MKPLKYNEFTGDRKGKKLINHRPTQRGHVSIHSHEAERLNEKSHRTRKYYELADEQPKGEATDESIEDYSASAIQQMNATDAKKMAYNHGAEGELTGKDAKEFLINLKNNE